MAQSDRDRDGAFEQLGEAVGGAAGRAAGRAADMAADVAGNVASTVFGTATRMLGDWWGGPDAERASRSFADRDDRTYREHFTASAGGATESSRVRDYDTARPLYRFGHTARHNPEYQGRSFREIEPELERAWEGEASTRYGPWPEVRGYVGFAYEEGPEAGTG